MDQKEWKTSGKFKGKFEWYNKTRKIQKSLCYESDPNAKIMHHLRDTEEQRKYNDEHYELWGFNLDGTFEYGKYIVFWTKEEHDAYHAQSEETRHKNSLGVKASITPERRQRMSYVQMGSRNSMYGKRGPEAPCYGRCGELHPMYGKVEPNKGKTFNKEFCDKVSAGIKRAKQFAVTQWERYKEVYGDISWRSFSKLLSAYMKTFGKRHDKYELFTFDDFIKFINIQ